MTVIGAAAFSAEGQIGAVQTAGSIYVAINPAGHDGVELRIRRVGVTATTLDNADFFR